MHPPILRVVSAISAKSVLIEHTELNIESNNKRFDSYGARNSVLIPDTSIDHIPYCLSGLSRALSFGQPFRGTQRQVSVKYVFGEAQIA